MVSDRILLLARMAKPFPKACGMFASVHNIILKPLDTIHRLPL